MFRSGKAGCTVAPPIKHSTAKPKAGGRACVVYCQGIPGPWDDVSSVCASVSCVAVVPLKVSRAQHEPNPTASASARRRRDAESLATLAVKRNKKTRAPRRRATFARISEVRFADRVFHGRLARKRRERRDYRGALRSASWSGASPQTRLPKITAKVRLGGTKRPGADYWKIIPFPELRSNKSDKR